MTFQRNDHVLVSKFIRRGDDADTEDREGWVVFHGEAVIVIANTPDWCELEPADYWTATFSLDEVIVTPLNERTPE